MKKKTDLCIGLCWAPKTGVITQTLPSSNLGFHANLSENRTISSKKSMGPRQLLVSMSIGLFVIREIEEPH